MQLEPLVQLHPVPSPPAPRRAQPGPTLHQLLRTGPFHDALRAAIATSGLSLDRIRERLRRRGADVSLASLSSWQSGRYRPERPRSLEALGVLEDLLALPGGSLVALLGPPRPRGRRAVRGVAGRSLETVVSADIRTALREVDTRWDASLTRISCHTRLELDAEGRTRTKWTRQLLRADCDGPDRWVTLYQLDDVPGAPPDIDVRPPCRAGNVVRRAASGLLAAEVLFDRPLQRGETAIVEYQLTHPHPRPFDTCFEATLHLPVREYVLEAPLAPRAAQNVLLLPRGRGRSAPPRAPAARRHRRVRPHRGAGDRPRAPGPALELGRGRHTRLLTARWGRPVRMPPVRPRTARAGGPSRDAAQPRVIQ